MRGGQYSGGLIGHSTGRRSLHGWGDTRVSPQPWREIDAHVLDYRYFSSVDFTCGLCLFITDLHFFKFFLQCTKFMSEQNIITQ